MKIVVAGDHFTVELIDKLSRILEEKGYQVSNFGTRDPNVTISLQEIIPAVGRAVQSNEVDFGILACGTGVGVEVGANKLKNIRASLCRDAAQAKNARVYDNANILCLGSWYDDNFEQILDAWLNNNFDGDPGRSQMLKDFETFAENRDNTEY